MADDLPPLTAKQQRVAKRVHSAALAILYVERARLVRELREAGWKLTDIGSLLALSKQRVEQLLRVP